MDEFYNEIKSYIQDEAHDHDKYFKLAEKAPTIKARKILMDIGREEKLHHEFLKEILADRPCGNDGEEESENDDEATEQRTSNSSKSEDDSKLSTNRPIDNKTNNKTATLNADIQ